MLIYSNQQKKMTNKKWAVKRITVNLAAQEAEKLEHYCQQTGRPATDVIRELIRGLPTSNNLKDVSS
jgi:predicted DNA-binding protein